ncbi:hypothetical protein FRC04_001989 [Tulasnella sp. 424]|nr:hypothetical protein FRC04_001989 [Tulasnella sp. 424]KAG8981090.1 hypothetical protein FRC05_003990 [Tulasnella sp. 425]
MSQITEEGEETKPKAVVATNFHRTLSTFPLRVGIRDEQRGSLIKPYHTPPLFRLFTSLNGDRFTVEGERGEKIATRDARPDEGRLPHRRGGGGGRIDDGTDLNDRNPRDFRDEQRGISIKPYRTPPLFRLSTSLNGGRFTVEGERGEVGDNGDPGRDVIKAIFSKIATRDARPDEGRLPRQGAGGGHEIGAGTDVNESEPSRCGVGPES